MKKNKKQTSSSQGWIVKLPKEKKEIKLDKKDRLILQALTQNARTTLSTLSKITNLSKNSIANRIKNYEKIGLTNGTSTFIDMSKLGLECFQVGIKTKMTLYQKEKFIEHLKKIKFLNQIMFLSSSHWNFMIRFYTKNTNHFNEIITNITSFKNIVDIEIMPIENVYSSPIKFIEPELDINKFIKKQDPSFQTTFNSARNKKLSFDKTDLKILNLLSNNSKIPITEIASKINSSKDIVKYRIKNLIRNNTLRHFFTNTNLFLLGFNAYLFSLQIFNREKINDIIEHLSSHPNCTGLMTTKGSWNILGGIILKDAYEIKKFEEEFFTKFEKYVHDYTLIQILEQPHYNLFIKEIIES